MNLKSMKYGFFTSVFSAATLLLGSCHDRSGMIGADQVEHVPAVNAATLSPAANETGTVKAYVGTQVSVEGFNLDYAGEVTIDGIAVAFDEQDIKTLKFKIPALHYPQRDLPYAVELNITDQTGRRIFEYNYFVTIPVTDALVTGYAPSEGSVGTEIALDGRNLEQITRVHFGEQTVEASAFTAQGDKQLKFLVPAGEYAEGDTQVTITAEWGENTIDVTGDELFALHIPRFDALAPQPAGKNSKIGDEIDLTGENLDYITAVKWGDYPLTIVEQCATALKVRFPATIEKMTPVVQTRALSAEYGAPAQVKSLAAEWRLDTTPGDAPVPVATSMTADDGGADNHFYLGKTVTVAGENLSVVEAVELRYNDGEARKIAATILAGGTDSQIQFTVPDGVTFSTATEVDVVAIHNTADEAAFGKADVYPFYYYKDLMISTGSSSKSTYPDANRLMAFFLPDQGRVVSVDEWFNTPVDSYAQSGANTLVGAANKLNAGVVAEQYYGVQPYLFFSASSSDKLGMNSPANSASQLKTHCYLKDGNLTALAGTYGTPIFYFRVLSDNADLKAAIIGGGVESVVDYATMGGSAAPALAVTESTSAWTEGSVIVAQYINHAHGIVGGKPGAADDIYRQGFMYIKEVTCADLSTGLAKPSREGHIKFDFYWSKSINK